MSGPIDSLRGFYDHSVRPLQDRAVDIAGDVARTAGGMGDAASDVTHAVADAGRDVADAVGNKGFVHVGVALIKADATQGAQVLTELQRRSPGDFIDWLTGPDGPSLADQTALVPGLQRGIGDVIDAAMANPMIAGVVGQAFGFEYVPGLDFYTTNESSIQSYLGFHDAYDKVGKLLGMDLDAKVVEVEVNGVGYKLELWKGSYGSGGAFGGEIGLYTRGTGERGLLGDLLEQIPGYYSSAAGDQQIRMTQEIYNTHGDPDKPYFTNDGKGADGNDGKHFWNLAIRTDPSVDHEDLGQRGTLEFTDPDVAKAICAELNRQDVPAQLSEDGLTVHYVWE
jgi:uncharacterized protein DUF4474